MTAFASLGDFVYKASGGVVAPETKWVYKHARIAGAAATATIAGRMASLWRYDGTPGAGAVPGAVSVPDNTTAGGMLQTDPGGGREKFLTYASVGGLNQGGFLLYDRLLHCGGLSGTSTSAQTVGGTITRNTGGEGNQIWVEINTAIGATATTITASYTNQSGTAGRTTTAIVFGGSTAQTATRFLCLPLQSGDTGVRAVASVTLAATTGTAGDFAVIIAKPLISVPATLIGAGGDVAALAKGRGPVKIDADACLAMAWCPPSTAAPEFLASFFFVES